jgi:cell wall-associated NlpC family hydrolase
MTGADVVTEARTWIGTPWVHQHTGKGSGCDCAGLVIGVARALGLVPSGFNVPAYGRQPNGTLLALCEEHMKPISRGQMAPGDVIAVATAQNPRHLGILADYVHGGLSLIHSTDIGKRGVVETRLMFAQNFRFVAAYRLPGVH